MFLLTFTRSFNDGSVYFYMGTLLIILGSGYQFKVSADSIDDSINSRTSPVQPISLKPATTSVLVQQTSVIPIIHAISDLTRDLDSQLKTIEDHELLISAIQSAFDSFERVPSTIEHNDNKMLNSIASKIEAKLSTGLRIINETSQKISTILMENNSLAKKLLLDAIILPCTIATKHSERSAHDSSVETNNQNDIIAGIDKRKAIDVLNFLKNAAHLYETDDRNFTINRKLMETLKSIDLSTSNFRDVFFLPRYSQVSTTNCRDSVPNDHHRWVIDKFCFLILCFC